MVKGSYTEIEALKVQIEDAFKLAIDNLIQVRAREGEALKSFIEDRLQKMKKEISDITKFSGETIEYIREKIEKKINELKMKLDQERLDQELIYLAQKMDITEELDRLGMHLIEVEDTLKKGGVVGRRLDFLMQELNREANTLGSKAQSGPITKKMVELKVLIEEMREQIQNLE